MQITVKSGDLGRELNLLEKIVGKKPTISVLGNVLLRAQGGGLLLSATDLEVGLIGACEAEIAVPGAVTLPAKKLMDLVRAQSDPRITLTEDTRGAVKFTSGKFVSRLQALPAADFPRMPPMEGEQITLPRVALQRAIKQVRYAITDKDGRFFMKGALMELGAESLTLVATDSARLAFTRLERKGPATDSVLIPDKAIDELDALLSESGGDVIFSRTERHLFFDVDARLLISRQVEGTFPAYQRIIPRENTHVATVHRETLVSVLRRLTLIDDVVVLNVSPGQLQVTSASAEVGDGVEQIEVDYNGPPTEMRFKGVFLLDFATTASGDSVDLCIKDANTALLLQDGEFVNVVMGMR